MKHPCHNRTFPETTTVQDGWKEVHIAGREFDPHGHYLVNRTISVRVPNMVEIPFTMSHRCHQWDLPFGAIHKGITDPVGCRGCKWKPVVIQRNAGLRKPL